MTTQPAAPAKPRRRRKEARPGEIIEAAIAVFSEVGFGAAKLEEVARRAGVAKGTVFVYFPNKEELFRAVARSIITANLERLQRLGPPGDLPLDALAPQLLQQAALVGEGRYAPILRMLIAESRTFPDLAAVWHDEVVSKVLAIVTGAITRAQARGEARPGDAQLMALSIVGPMLAGIMFRQVFGATGAALPDLKALAEQHSRLILHGILASDRG